MTTIRSIIRKCSLITAVAVLTALPLGSFSYVSADEPCQAPDQSTYGPGVHSPSGAEAAAFTYQCEGKYQGLWLSERFTYTPQTNKKAPRVPVAYVYNKATGKYDFSYWAYSAARATYTLIDDSTSNPPADDENVDIIGGPEPAAPAATQPTTGTGSAASRAAAASNTGLGSNATANNIVTNNGAINNNTGTNVTNTITSNANSGNALVLSNTSGGSATSGDVISQANVTNMLQSSSNAMGDGTNVATFTYTIDGDVTGDLLFDPNMISDVQGNVETNDSLNNNLNINNTSDASINNNLNLTSVSGDATVANNTSGGDATTGSARSVANIVNSIRSAITSGKSFVGTINITGNLNGDILLPANFVDQLVASNVPTVAVSGPNSTNTVNSSTTNNTTVTNTNNQGISNNINSKATSGDASVSGNTEGGAAKSGSANTNVTAFNLTGSRVVAKNSILVYVNVLGKWTGLIVNAPAGATAVQLGGNVTKNETVTNNTTANNTSNQQINNNVNVTAQSGDATVSGNTKGGNATAGDAETAVNLVNIEDSSFELSDWFGILYINVFGTWNGSFGMDTAAGNQVGGRGADQSQEYLVGNVGKLVRYPATTNQARTATASTTTPASAATTNTNVDEGTVLAAETKTAPKPVVASIADDSQSTASKLWLPLLGLIAFAAIIGAEKFSSRRSNK